MRPLFLVVAACGAASTPPATPVAPCQAPVLPKLAAQHTPNRSKLYVASIDHGKVGTPVLVTDKLGYVNQPAFTSDGRGLYFTWRPDGGQSDIWLHDLAGHTERAITCSSEEEYAASEAPDHRLTAIRVEPDLTKHLVALGPPVEKLLPAVTGVGAYRWVDDHTMAVMTVEADGTNHVALADPSKGTLDIIGGPITGAIAVTPDRKAISYVSPEGDMMQLVVTDVATRASKVVRALPDGVDNASWLDDTTVLIGSGTKLMTGGVTGEWRELADLGAALAGPITRIVLAPDRQRVALVVHVD